MSKQKYHELKIVEPYYTAVSTGKKTFEIRRNDRDFKIGDRLILSPYDPALAMYESGKPTLIKEITYITDYAQKSGFVVMSIIEPEIGQLTQVGI
jgi:ASC-1-like (ASCH) protein